MGPSGTLYEASEKAKVLTDSLPSVYEGMVLDDDEDDSDKEFDRRINETLRSLSDAVGEDFRPTDPEEIKLDKAL